MRHSFGGLEYALRNEVHAHGTVDIGSRSHLANPNNGKKITASQAGTFEAVSDEEIFYEGDR